MNTIGRALACAAVRTSPGRGRGFLRRASTLLVAAVPALLLALAAPDARADFASQCSSCHTTTDPGRINAANASAVVHVAAQVNAMTGVTSTTNVTQAVADIAAAAPTPASGGGVTYTAWNAATTSVAYGGSRAVTVPNITLGGVLSSVSHSPAVTGVSFAGTTMTFNHPGGAGGNCSTRTINAFGTGAAVGGITPNTANRVITVTVTPPAAPTAANDSTTIAYSTGATTIDLGALGAISGTVPATGTTPGLGTPSPNVGTVSGTGPDTFTYAANATVYAPTVTVAYNVTGPCSTTSLTRTLTINVNPPPAPVVANVGSAVAPTLVPAGSATNFNLTASISGVVASNPAATYALVASQPTAPGSGTTSVLGNVVTFTPGAGFTGPTTFTYTKDGPGGTSNTATVFIDVTAAPIVAPTSVTTAFNTAIAVPLAGFITSSQPVTSVTPSAPVGGTAIATGPTTITFTPTAGVFGTGSFSYTATNAGGTSASPALVTVTVNPPPPTVAARAATVPYNSGNPVVATTIDLATSIGPVGATVLSVTPSGAIGGTVVATGPTTVAFTPTPGLIGAASFTYTATNAGGTSAGSATVSVTVSPPAPPATRSFDVLVSNTMPTQVDLAQAISGGPYTSVAIDSQPGAGMVTLVGTMATYTPAPGYTGDALFIFRALGPGGTSAPATVRLTYTAAPVTANRSLFVPFNGTGSIDLTNALAGNITSFSITRQPANGVLVLDGGPVVTYKPNTGFFGADSFQFTATGPGGTSVPGTVSITVHPPVATVTGLDVTVPFETATLIDLTRAITGAASGFTVSQPPAHGTLTINGTIATYTPTAGYSGDDSFSVAAVNATGTSQPGTIRITVGGLAPTAATASLTVPVNGSGTVDLAPFIRGSSISGVSIAVMPAHGLTDVNGTKVTYTPRTNFFGTDTFTYLAYGNAGTSQPVVVTVTVVGRPDPTQDKTVTALVDAQAQTARRFTRAQIGNFQRRLESLHAGPPPSESPKADAPASPSPAAAAPAPAPAARAPAPDPFARPQAASGFMPVSLTSAEPRPKAAASFLERAIAGTLVTAANSKSVDLASATGGAAPAPALGTGTNVWVGGLANFGKQGGTEESTDLRFSTDGISAGVDRRFSDRLVLGFGMGYGRDDTDIGTDGSKTKTKGASFAAYGSYQPSRSTFVDAVVGFGSLDIDTHRFVAGVDDFAVGTRKGNQAFGSLAAGYEWRRDGVLVSPYGRIDVSVDKLKESTETGAGLNALTFESQTLRSTQAAAGIRFESRHETDYGWFVPRLRAEYRHEFQDGTAASLRYADQFGGTVYSVTPTGTSRNALLVGVGGDFMWRRGLKLGIDYQGERTSSPGTSQAIRFLLTQDLDGRFPDWPSAWSWQALANSVNVEAGYTFDDNVSRGRIDTEKFSDSVYSLGLSTSRTFPLQANTRAVATALLNVDKFHDNTGLGRTSGGLQGEVQYRSSGDFDAISYALFARGWIDGYESKLRSGFRASAGANARRSITDRIDVFGEIGTNWRRAESAVFEGRDYAAKLNVDYSLGTAGTAYIAGEYRRGDTFASGFGSLWNLNVADVFVRDDAFDRADLFAYRFEARTLLGTIGYNRPLGPSDSLDFSYRRVLTTPLRPPEPGPSNYGVNQYSILYLMRF